MYDFSKLPPKVQQQLDRHLLEFLSSIGVQPMVDKRTGELRVPLDQMARAMGKTEAEIRAELEGIDGLVTADPSDMAPLN